MTGTFQGKHYALAAALGGGLECELKLPHTRSPQGMPGRQCFVRCCSLRQLSQGTEQQSCEVQLVTDTLGAYFCACGRWRACKPSH